MAEVLCAYSVPRLYDIVRRPQIGSYAASVNYHVSCGQSFSALWPMRAGGIGWSMDTCFSDTFYCPRCGERLEAGEFTATVRGYRAPIPISAELAVVRRPGEIDLVLKYDAVLYDTDFKVITKGRKSRRTDIIRFDFRKRQTLYIKKGLSRSNITEVIPPFFHCDWSQTPWCYIQANWTSYMVHYKTELEGLVKTLKAAFKQELDKRIGYRSKAVRQRVVHGENGNGALGGLIENLVWRMVCPDGPAVTNELRDEALRYCEGKLSDRITEITQKTVAGESFINALMASMGIRSSRAARRLVNSRPFYGVAICKLVQAFTENPSYERLLIEHFEMVEDGNSGVVVEDFRIPQFIRFAAILRMNWGEKAAMDFLLKRDLITVRDTGYLYSRLHRPGRIELWRSRIKLRDLHDWLSAKVQLQDIEDVPVQGTLRYKALQDQIGAFDFEVPTSTKHIAVIGIKLNNCVRTYCERVIEGKTAIVEVRRANDTVACLEVNSRVSGEKFNLLSQAKLKNNKKVATDPTINAAVVEWANKHKLSLEQVRFDVAGGGAV